MNSIDIQQLTRRILAIKERADKAKEALIEGIAEGVAHGLKWKTEEALKAELMATETSKLRILVAQSPQDPEAILNTAAALKDRLVRHLIQNPYNHCSTGVMSNYVDQMTTESAAAVCVLLDEVTLS